MFKRTEEQEWTRFSKALSSRETEEGAQAEATEPAAPAVAENTESAAPVPLPPVQSPPQQPVMSRPPVSDVNVSVSRIAQPTPRGSYASGDVQSVIGPQTSFSGTLNSETSVRILGSVDGEIISSQAVMIEEQARVKAKVSAEAITVAGEVTGELHCAGRVEILPTGRVHGEIQAGTLVMQEGAFFEGNLKMGAAIDTPSSPASETVSESAGAARGRR
jgi:cytoskeletal protein CcmA (bactofilin family)